MKAANEVDDVKMKRLFLGKSAKMSINARQTNTIENPKASPKIHKAPANSAPEYRK
jgi:hypothetical protein